MSGLRSARRSPTTTTWLWWTAGFVAFPIGGLAGGALAGPVASPGAALLGGVVTGAVLGAGQVLASRRRLPVRWIPATAVGMGVGLLLGASAVGFATSLPALAVQGALSGLVIGALQAAALPAGTTRGARWRWAGAGPVLWALGWVVTTSVGVDVEAHYTVFGASGALAWTVLSWWGLTADTAPATRHAAVRIRT